MIAYLVTNKVNGKQYVGITTRKLSRRWYEHKYVPQSSGKALSAAIKKYGESAFEIKQIASCTGDIETLKQLESDLIEQYNTFKIGYNSTKGGDGVFGFKHSEETVKRVADKNRGRKASSETKTKMREAHGGEKNHFFGKQHTEDARKRNAEAHFKGTILAISEELATVIELNGPKEIRDAGFHPGHVYSCVTGNEKTHRNFTFKRI
jgi:group I intron endonuclease